MVDQDRSAKGDRPAWPQEDDGFRGVLWPLPWNRCGTCLQEVDVAEAFDGSEVRCLGCRRRHVVVELVSGKWRLDPVDEEDDEPEAATVELQIGDIETLAVTGTARVDASEWWWRATLPDLTDEEPSLGDVREAEALAAVASLDLDEPTATEAP